MTAFLAKKLFWTAFAIGWGSLSVVVAQIAWNSIGAACPMAWGLLFVMSIVSALASLGAVIVYVMTIKAVLQAPAR